MKTVSIIIVVLLLPITIYSTEVQYVDVCKRVDGCKLISSAITMDKYCPTCVKEIIIISLLDKPKKIHTHKWKDSSMIMWVTKHYIKYL